VTRQSRLSATAIAEALAKSVFAAFPPTLLETLAQAAVRFVLALVVLIVAAVLWGALRVPPGVELTKMQCENKDLIGGGTMNIDQNAPMTACKEIFIAAPLEKVWALQTDIERWPEWQPDVASAKLEGDLAVGTIFRWKAQGINITSTLQEVEPGRRIGWTGSAIGMTAVHIWTFEPREDGTWVITEESLSGWLPRILKIFDPAFLEKSLDESLQVLKAKAEQP
jgi:uncharacterized protein YndB with AHSA1/START domain